VEQPNVVLDIQQSIVGGIRIVDTASAQIHDSVLDATGDNEFAYSAPEPSAPAGHWNSLTPP